VRLAVKFVTWWRVVGPEGIPISYDQNFANMQMNVPRMLFRRGQVACTWQVRCSQCPVRSTSKLCSAFMVAWSRLVSSESAITTDATSATHLRCFFEVTVIISRDMEVIVSCHASFLGLESAKTDQPESVPNHKSTHDSPLSASQPPQYLAFAN